MTSKDITMQIVHIFKGGTSNTIIQLIRYTFVGGFAFAVDFGLLFLLTEYGGLNYLVSACLSFIAGLVTNYFISIYWVFQKSTISNKFMEFGIFTIIGIVGLLLTEILMWFFTSILGLFYLISKLQTTIIVYFWNFFARKYIIFNK